MPNIHSAPADANWHAHFAWPNAAFLDKITGFVADGHADLDGRLTSLTTSLGFDFFSLVIVPSVASRLPRIRIRSSYFADWKRRYQEHAYCEIDPIVQLAPTARRPYIWGRKGDLTDMTPAAERLMNEGRSYSIRFGISVPTHGPNGEFTLLTMATGQTQRALEELVRNCYNLMWMISPLVHDAASVDGPKAVSSISEVRTETVELSNQQKRCLALTLQGKTSGQIAEIISRSRVTVEYHLQRAMRQLGVRTKIAAAVYAMKAGIIVV